MGLVAGSVTVTGPDPLVESGTGMAWAIYLSDKATSILLDPGTPPVGWPSGPSTWETKAKASNFNILKEIARKATAYSAAIIPYLKSNSEIEVTVKTTDASLQRTPNPNNPNTNTLGPSSDKTLAGILKLCPGNTPRVQRAGCPARDSQVKSSMGK